MDLKKYISGICLTVILSLMAGYVCFAETTETAGTEEADVSDTSNGSEVQLFTDVSVGHPEYTALKYLKEKGIIKGYADGSFRPAEYINRVEALKIIMESNGVITDSYIENNKLGGKDFNLDAEKITFTDIYKSQWYYPYVKKAVLEGVVSGYPDNTFQPLKTVNRAESYKMTMESDGIVLPEVTENPFSDVYVNEWHAPYFQEAKNRQIVYVTMQDLVNPAREMKRSRFAELVYRYLRSNEGHKFGKGTFYSDYFEGRSTSSGEPYKASELTAAHLTLPFGTYVKVTNLANDNSVTVKINDRGPFVTGRVIDLSRTAFEQIAHPGTGVIYVEYEIINS
jgi:rare lipoprotein A